MRYALLIGSECSLITPLHRDMFSLQQVEERTYGSGTHRAEPWFSPLERAGA